MVAGSTAAGDPRFFARSGPHPVAAVAAACGAPAPATARMLRGVAPLQTAGPDDVSFLDNRRYAPALEQTRAGAVIVHPALAARVPPTALALVTTEPYVGWARVAALFHPAPPPRPGVHPLALVEPGAEVHPTAEIGPFAVIAAGARIGPGCRIGPAAVIGEGVAIGAACRVGAHASISHALLGERVFIYPGARIGQEGFGFATTAAGFVTVPQLGRVVIEDDVEIGANVTVDRGALGATVIGKGTKIDNLVQVAHNVTIGEHSVLVAQVGIAGSTKIGRYVTIAGQVGIAGHLKIGDQVTIAAQSGVMTDVPAKGKWLGSPAQPDRQTKRQMIAVQQLPELIRRVRELEEQVRSLSVNHK